MNLNELSPDPPLKQKITTVFNVIWVSALTLEVFLRHSFSARYIKSHLAGLFFSILAFGGVGLIGIIFFASALEKAARVSRLPQFFLISFFLMVVHIAVGLVLKFIRKRRYGTNFPARIEYLSRYWGSSWLSSLLQYLHVSPRLSPRLVQMYIEPICALVLGFLLLGLDLDRLLGIWMIFAAVCLFFKEQYYVSQGEDIYDQQQDQRILAQLRNSNIQSGSPSTVQQRPARVRINRGRPSQ